MKHDVTIQPIGQGWWLCRSRQHKDFIHTFNVNYLNLEEITQVLEYLNDVLNVGQITILEN